MIKNLYVMYRYRTESGQILDSNIILTNVPLLATMKDIERIQGGIADFLKVKEVRILHWQRMETNPPREQPFDG